MSVTVRSHSGSSARRLLGVSLISGAAITMAACGASSTTPTSGSGSSPAAGTSSSAGSSSNTGPSSSSAVTVSTRNVPGVGTVLVNGQGQTLYLLTSEKGGKITCTESTGCTKLWPEINLPSGATAAKAGSGVQASLLGTVQGAAGQMEATYNGWPLYTYAGDSRAGVAHGQGITSFGGTWYVLSSTGDPVTKASSGGSGSGGSGGYGY